MKKSILFFVILIIISSCVFAETWNLLDDFSHNDLNENGWENVSSSGAVSIHDGMVEIHVTANNNDNYIRYNNSMSTNANFTMKALMKVSCATSYSIFQFSGRAATGGNSKGAGYGALFGTGEPKQWTIFDEGYLTSYSDKDEPTDGEWYWQIINYNGSHLRLKWWHNSTSESTEWMYNYSRATLTSVGDYIMFNAGTSGGIDCSALIDEVWIYSSAGYPVISDINCTSCNIPYGDNESPYTTSDTTPTFKFNTNINTFCRISNENINYSTMGASKDCSTTGAKNHVCTLTTQDELVYSTDYVYIGCLDEGTNATASFEMDLTGLENTTSNSIDVGIQHSVIWPGATVYSDQQVYLRDLDNNQVLATVDRVAVYGSQRWIFNYALDNESKAGLFNITPAVYALDMVNISSSEIESRVSGLINSTKN